MTVICNVTQAMFQSAFEAGTRILTSLLTHSWGEAISGHWLTAALGWRSRQSFSLARWHQMSCGLGTGNDWLRHMTLVRATQAFLVVLRHQIESLLNAQKN